MKKLKVVLALMLVLVTALSLFVLTACNDQPEDPVVDPIVETPTGKKSTDRLYNLSMLKEEDASMINNYTMIAVENDAFPSVEINEAGADAFIKWMSLASTRTLIAEFGKDKYGEALFFLKDNAQTYTGEIAAATAATKDIALSTTTSVNDSGLLGYLAPLFENAYGYDLDIASQGTGAAITSATVGEADLLLVHSASAEKEFIDNEKNYARTVEGLTGTVLDADYPERVTFMYNYFVLVGPTADAAGAKNAASVLAAFEAIYDAGAKFVSRGDASGTHNKETALWTAASEVEASSIELGSIALSYKSKGLTTTKNVDAPFVDGKLAGWYYSAGQGMGVCLVMANELNAYCLTDKGTYLAYKYWVEA